MDPINLNACLKVIQYVVVNHDKLDLVFERT